MTTLLQAFHDDHAVLGRGFHDISTLLRGGDVAAARQAAIRLDKEAGPHVAFEERHFYPTLRKLIGDEDVDRFYEEHHEGLDVVRALITLERDQELSEAERTELIRQSEIMEAHIAECGELFEAMGRIPPGDQEALLQALQALRDKGQSWMAFVAEQQREGSG